MHFTAFPVVIAALSAMTVAKLNRRQSIDTMSLLYESMPLSSSPSISLASSTAKSPSSTPLSASPSVSSANDNNLMTTAYLTIATITASHPSSSEKNYNASSTSSTSDVSMASSSLSNSDKSTASMGVTTADFTSGQSPPTSLVLATTSFTNSSGQSAMPTSTSWDIVGGRANGTSGMVGGTATATAGTQGRPSRGAKAAVPPKASFMALGVLVCFMVVFA